MDKKSDTRNWKCIFGWHQWDVFTVKDVELYRSDVEQWPYRTYQRITLKCAHCGKITKREL